MGNYHRKQPLPTMYDEWRLAVLPVDFKSLQIYISFGIIIFSFLIVLPGIRGMERLRAFLRVLFALVVGSAILLGNFGPWCAAKVCTRTRYKAHVPAFSRQDIQAEIGISIGLRGINITLLEKACFEDDDYWPNRPFPGESINYNEQFYWSDPWGQGQKDFGPNGGRFNQEYRAGMHRGTPYPIMWVAEPFTLDGEQLRWYRKYRIAGYCTHCILWTAFATYLASIILFTFVIRWASIHLLITGWLMELAVLQYYLVIMNDPELSIHFPDGDLKPEFSWAYWTTMSGGILTIVTSLWVLILDYISPRRAAILFHHSVTLDDSMFMGDDFSEPYPEKRDGTLDFVRKLSRMSHGGSKFGRQDTLTRKNDSLKRRSAVICRDRPALEYKQSVTLEEIMEQQTS